MSEYTWPMLVRSNFLQLFYTTYLLIITKLVFIYKVFDRLLALVFWVV